MASHRYLLGYHVTVYNHTPGPCRQVPGVEHGAEDMETLPNGMTFITSGFKWSVSTPKFMQLYKDQDRKGRVLLFNFNTPDKGVVELGFDENFDQSTFFPHGISVLQNADTGKITLFVVNHCPEEDRIEKFEFIEDKMMLQHKISYTDEAVHSYIINGTLQQLFNLSDLMVSFGCALLHRTRGSASVVIRQHKTNLNDLVTQIATLVNDVAATSENSFYFTNYAHFRTSIFHLLESILLLPWGNIVYFDGGNYMEAADGLVTPNGILLSTDKKFVYVANPLFTSVSIFEREEDNHLNIVQEYQVYSGPDNLLIEPKTGNLLTGAHPVMHQTAAHLASPDLYVSPSKVLMIHMKNTSFADGITEIYSDDGKQISGSSVASIYDSKMLVGSVVDKLIYCEVRTLE